MKVGDLVRYVGDGDIGVITSIDKNGMMRIEWQNDISGWWAGDHHLEVIG